MELITASELSTQARDLGKRTGDVLSRKDGRYIDFVYDPHLNSRLIESAETVFPEYDPEYGERYTKPLDNYTLRDQLAEPIPDNKLVHRLTQTGGAVIGYAGMEQVTHQPIISLMGITVGGIAGYIRRRVTQDVRMSRRKSSLVQNLEDIKAAFNGPEAVRLPLGTKPIWLSAEQTTSLEDSEIMVSGSDNASVPARDVLSWLENGIASDSPTVDIPGWILSPATSPYRPTRGPSVRINTSLWRMFKEIHDASQWHLDLFGAKDKERAADFVKARTAFAEVANVKLQAAKPDFFEQVRDTPTGSHVWDYVNESRQKDAKEMTKKYGPGWQDGSCNYIYLPPGKVVARLLRTSKDPTELWDYISADVKLLAEMYSTIEDVDEQAWKIQQRTKQAGVTTVQSQADLYNMNEQLARLRQEALTTTLSIAARAMVIDKASRYETARESLLSKMSTTAEATGQFSALELFDKGIDALVANLPPDSEEAIETSKELQRYLEDSMQYLDGSQDAYDQLYAGMRQKFPQLKLA